MTFEKTYFKILIGFMNALLLIVLVITIDTNYGLFMHSSIVSIKNPTLTPNFILAYRSWFVIGVIVPICWGLYDGLKPIIENLKDRRK